MIKIALLGFGNVGRAFARYLTQGAFSSGSEVAILGLADVSGALLFTSPTQIGHLLERLKKTELLSHYPGLGRFMGVEEFLQSLSFENIAVLVECLPTNPTDGQPALDYLKRAIQSGINVVTVDKGPMVHGFEQLSLAAQGRNVTLAFTGTTGVPPPPELNDCTISEIRGILNGTTNYILTRMQEDCLPFSQALSIAQERGIAESNPALDIEGWDTACKILILANAWMSAGATLPDVSRIGIGPATEGLIKEARNLNGTVRLLGKAQKQDGGIDLTVRPEIVGKDSPFLNISGTSKAAIFTTLEWGELFAKGRSGLDSISKTIYEDILSVIRGRA